MKIKKPKGLWISVDGTEGVGKTEVAKHLNSSFTSSILAPEFSDGTIGKFLHKAVQDQPHIISKSLIEQSLLFLADHFKIYDTLIATNVSQGYIVISDRGYASKYIYQLIVLSKSYDYENVRGFLDNLFSLISPPDLTLLLGCEKSVQTKRLIKRDGHCDSNRIGFIQEANREYNNFLLTHNCPFVQINQTPDITLHLLLKNSVKIVHDFFTIEERE